MRTTARALLLAPLVALLFDALLMALIEMPKAKTASAHFHSLAVMATVSLAMSYGVTATIAVPLHLLLRRFGVASVWAYLGIGTVLSGATLLTLALMVPDPTPRTVKDAMGMALIVLSGPALAGMFWCLARPKPKLDDRRRQSSRATTSRRT
jgi:hypothetical protein